MNRRQRRLEGQVGKFIQQYRRKRKNTPDPNDRGYDRGIEAIVKKMDPIELDRLLHGNSEDDRVSE